MRFNLTLKKYLKEDNKPLSKEERIEAIKKADFTNLDPFKSKLVKMRQALDKLYAGQNEITELVNDEEIASWIEQCIEHNENDEEGVGPEEYELGLEVTLVGENLREWGRDFMF